VGCKVGAEIAVEIRAEPRSPRVGPGRPTQSIMYVPLRVNRSQKSILLIVQYKYLKSCSGDFYSPVKYRLLLLLLRKK